MSKSILSNIFIAVAIVLTSISPAMAQDSLATETDPLQEEQTISETNSNQEEQPTTEVIYNDVIISEVQTNGEVSGTSNEEFIELYNNGDDIVNLLDFKLLYITSTGTESNLYKFTEPFMLLPKTFIIGKLAESPEDFLTEITTDFTYVKGSTGIAATGGGLKLIDPGNNIVDEVYWSSSSSSATPAVVSLMGGLSAQRYYLDEELIIDENNDFTKEFIVKTPTPGDFLYELTLEQDEGIPTKQEDQQAAEDQSQTVDNPKIYINELFIDPVSPQLDSQDEFVEIYNPNSQKLDISDYVISAGLTTTYKHTLPKGTFINANGYFVIKSANSSLTLANSGGRVTLVDNQNRQIDSIDYQNAESGAAWAKSGNSWYWTIKPTPNSENIINKPIVIKKTLLTSSTSTKTSTTKSAKTNFTKAPPIKINEIFPDPASPQKDSQDEFIELYNPYDYSINIADYTITSGATRTYKYTIKAPAIITANGFFTVTSAETPLSLTNSGGKVTLINNFDQQIDSVEYPEATPGSSWAFIDGKWQWTASPTKNAPNKLSGLIDGLNSNKEESAAQVAGAIVAGTDDTPLVPAPQPLPGWLLAVLGVTAVCYAAYEYRFEFKNYYYKYRTIHSSR